MTDHLAFDILDDFAFVPVYPKMAARLFRPGERVILQRYEDRSKKSHDHFFAVVHDAWLNLPEDQVGRFGDSEHLRNWCLIRAGYRDTRTMVCRSHTEALKLAAFIRPMDSFAVVTVEHAVVEVHTARSQSMKAMGREAFQESKESVFRVLSEILGVDPTTLRHEAGRAA